LTFTPSPGSVESFFIVESSAVPSCGLLLETFRSLSSPLFLDRPQPRARAFLMRHGSRTNLRLFRVSLMLGIGALLSGILVVALNFLSLSIQQPHAVFLFLHPLIAGSSRSFGAALVFSSAPLLTVLPNLSGLVISPFFPRGDSALYYPR